ncbi:MAG TPA: hypothetical protein PKV71_11760 [Calditrichia bacterium]|nr:hypothetical protein [Calditrichota bacterium]HQU71875.1 hypothetical protein [Calditrichia bacterium]HQV32549.1 hypothetical protein [Calditrichia bacterium]
MLKNLIWLPVLRICKWIRWTFYSVALVVIPLGWFTTHAPAAIPDGDLPDLLPAERDLQTDLIFDYQSLKHRVGKKGEALAGFQSGKGYVENTLETAGLILKRPQVLQNGQRLGMLSADWPGGKPGAPFLLIATPFSDGEKLLTNTLLPLSLAREISSIHPERNIRWVFLPEIEEALDLYLEGLRQRGEEIEGLIWFGESPAQIENPAVQLTRWLSGNSGSKSTPAALIGTYAAADSLLGAVLTHFRRHASLPAEGIVWPWGSDAQENALERCAAAGIPALWMGSRGKEIREERPGMDLEARLLYALRQVVLNWGANF